MKKRIFAIALIMLITLSIFVPISASAEEVEENYVTFRFYDEPNLVPFADFTFNVDFYYITETVTSGRIIRYCDGITIQNGMLYYEWYKYNARDEGDIFVDKSAEAYGTFDGYLRWWEPQTIYLNISTLTADEIGVMTTYIGEFIEGTPDNDNGNNSIPQYVFYPDRIDKKISGVEDIILGIYENDTMPRPSEDGYTVIFQNNGTYFIASASQPFRKYSSSSSIMLADQSNFDYWAIDGAMIQYLGKTASFTPVNWIAGTHDVLNWNDNSVYQSFENIGNVAFPKTPPTQTQTLPSVVGAKMLAGVTTEMIAILPCLIALLTVFLGLRKALAILRMILETA